MNDARWAQAEMLGAENGIPTASAYVVLGLFQGDAALVSAYAVELRNTPKERHSEVASRYLVAAWDRA